MVTMLLDQCGIPKTELNTFTRILNISCQNPVVGVSAEDF